MSLRMLGTLTIPSPNEQRLYQSASMPTTSCPRPSSIGVSTVPMYPRCPVTRIFMFSSTPFPCAKPSTSQLGRALLPYLPRRFAGFPQAFQQALVAERVHALPEPAVTIGHQLPVARQLFHGLTFPGGLVTFDVIENAMFENEESAVDPAL